MSEDKPEEILVAPLDAIVGKIAQSVAKAQMEFDAAAKKSFDDLATQHKDLADLGYMPTWYHMPEVNVELKMVMHFDKKEEKGKKSWLEQLWSPFNANYQSSTGFGYEGTSSIKIRIVSSPPPVTLSHPRQSPPEQATVAKP